MTGPNWISRLLGRKPEGDVSPPGPAWREAPPESDGEYVAHRDRGLRQLAAGRLAEAMNALGRAVHLRPDLAEAHLNMGCAFQRAGKVEAARQAYQRALELDLTCAEARSALAALPPPPPAREDFQVGQVLGSGTTGTTYRVLEVKKGGFGAVYIVREEKSGRFYALKTFQARYLWSDEDRDRFEREAITWVMLDRHPNIVTAYWAERIEGFPCLVLEYVPGGDLAQLLSNGPIPVGRALELALQFCDGMAYAHGKLGIVHRDVKPSNCLLAEDGTLKVADFGLARAFAEGQESVLGLSGLEAEVRSQYTMPAGTPQYMAPEQFRAGAQLDTVYRSVTGRAALAPVAPSPLGAAEWEKKGGSLFVLGRHEEALACFERALEINPRDSTLWNNRALALGDLGRREEALRCFERALEINVGDKILWLNKGAELYFLGRYEEALASYARGLEIDPGDSVLWNNRGNALIRLKRHEEALACYARGLEIDPRHHVLWKNKGEALAELGRYEEALTCFERALQIHPRDSEVWKYKGLSLFNLGRYEDAVACLRRAKELGGG